MSEAENKRRDKEIAEIRADLREASRLLKEHIAESKANAEEYKRQQEQRQKQRQEEYEQWQKEREERQKAAEERQKAAEERQEEYEQQQKQRQEEYEQWKKDYEERQKAADARQKQRQEEYEQWKKDYEQRQEERSKAIDNQLEELGKQIGGANNRWGKIVEELVAGDLTAIVRTHLNRQVHYISTRVRPADRTWEIDVLATNGDIAVPAEVKTTLTKDDIDKFVSHILKRFTTILPEHKHKLIYGVIAFVKIEGNESEVIGHALKQGLIIVKAMNGTNKVLNDKDFEPHDFCPQPK